MLVTLAAALGQIGLPGGGFGTSYHYSSGGAPLANGPFVGGIPSKVAPVRPVKPWQGSKVLHVAAITDALEHPGAVRDFDGKKGTYPHFRMIMWAGGNPFVHHPDTFRLERAWKKPDTVVVTDVVWTATALHADIVLPACTFLEHNDISVIGTNSCDGVVAMHQAIKPQYESRSDYWIYSQLAKKLGFEKEFTEGRTEMQWIEKIYNDARGMSDVYDITMPDFKTFWEKGFSMTCRKKHAGTCPLQNSVPIPRRISSIPNPALFSFTVRRLPGTSTTTAAGTRCTLSPPRGRPRRRRTFRLL